MDIDGSTSSRKAIEYFNRLTWLLSDKTGVLRSGDKLVEEEDSAEREAEGDVIQEEEELGCSTRTKKDQSFMSTVAALPTRTNRKVAMSWDGKRLFVLEASAGLESSLTFAKEPRRELHTVKQESKDVFRMEDYGLWLRNIKTSDMRSSLSPTRPMLDHLAYLVRYLELHHSAISMEEKRCILHGMYIYIVRSSHPKIHARIGYGSKDLRRQRLVIGKSRKQDKRAAGFVDYATILLPSVLDASSPITRMFEGSKVMDGAHREVILRLGIGRKDAPNFTKPAYDPDYLSVSMSDFDKQAMNWASEVFSLPRFNIDDPNCVSVHIGTLLTAFLSGIHTITVGAYKDDNMCEITEMGQQLQNLGLEEMSPGLRKGLDLTVSCGVALSGLLSGVFILRFFEYAVPLELHEGFVRWLCLITESFSAITELSSRPQIERVLTADVYVLEVFLHGSHSNMTSIPETIERLNFQPPLESADQERLTQALTSIPHSETFGGTAQSCEVVVLLLVLIARMPELAAKFPKDLMDHFGSVDPRVFGISKRCCLVCAMLVRITGQKLGQNIETSGSHSRISPCSLPPWTPIEIIDAITKELEALVRPMLLKKVQELRPSVKADRGSASPLRKTQPSGFRFAKTIEIPRAAAHSSLKQ
ncbi:hypothetical protein BJ508DRAFT_350746 [Ascobolus immersus RN42]|uniref:Uncharacterized protein n=1 Tax=Ascobolus immersus RN42 TaxID=1160509 RepID=A0A3N4HVL5_ASCIM|nr:hypothetical protein BJ508DRAFT_350746 [Ascobolus immersus RN42]